jgi:probable F420-dependent oxidoreductase
MSAPHYCLTVRQILEGASVRFGMQLPVQSQSTYYVEPWEATAGRDELAAIATACDESGFDYVAVCDHVAIPADRAEAMGTAWYDTVATLGWLAGITERVRLLSHVWVPAYRHPLATAKAFATLDELSGGRAILGVGAGHVEAEFDVLGVPFADRGRLTDEAIDGIRAAWSAEFGWGDGGFGQQPRPRQHGGPPIWVGGSSPPALRRAALRGDGWLPQGTTKAEMAAAIESIDAQRTAAGRAGPFTHGAIVRPLYLGDPGPDWDLGRGTLVGDADRVRREVADYEAMGVDQVQVRFRSRSCEEYVAQVHRFAQEVM